jgi:hypothetical protein
VSGAPNKICPDFSSGRSLPLTKDRWFLLHHIIAFLHSALMFNS